MNAGASLVQPARDLRNRVKLEVEMVVPITEQQMRTLAFFSLKKDGSPDGRAE
ncbi:hypothetical protein [Paraburkholderia fungorum]|uniref:hypothetical protein n=1 Tax=Paraburkholderia fungorum TaxID=134537 RepID=UPI001C1EFB44|nr:hypothetical protein [Paraburkholderia fungorum]MBU7443510.1 hypothetical protein [Paraburkholderia fungorum]